MKKIFILFFLLIASPVLAQPTGGTPNYFVKTDTIISPRTAGNSISVDSTGNMIVSGDIVLKSVPFPSDTPADNDVIKYDSALGRLNFEVDGGAGGGVDSVNEGVIGPLIINPTTGAVIIDIVSADATTDGYIKQDQWNKINIISNDAIGWTSHDISSGTSHSQVNANTTNIATNILNIQIISNDAVQWKTDTTRITIISNDLAVNIPKITQLSADAVDWNKGELVFTIDGGGSAITTGAKSWIVMPYKANIISWEVTAQPSGSISIGVMKDFAAQFPPDNDDRITGTFQPFLASDTISSDTTLAGWTTNLNSNDYIRVSVDSATTCTNATLILTLRKN